MEKIKSIKLYSSDRDYILPIEPYMDKGRFFYEGNKSCKLASRIVSAFTNLGYKVYREYKGEYIILRIHYVGVPLEEGVLLVYRVVDAKPYNDYWYDTIELCELIQDVQNSMKNGR